MVNDQVTPRASTAKKVLITLGVLALIGAVTGIGLLLAYPAPTVFAGGMAMNFLKTLGAPAGTVTQELNPAYKAPETAASSAVRRSDPGREGRR